MKSGSIKSQLLLWLLIPLVMLSVVKLYVSHTFADHRSQELYDEMLRNAADSIVSRLDYKDGKVSLDFPKSAQAIFRHKDKDKFWFRVNQTDGTFLAGDQLVPNLGRTNDKEILYEYGVVDGAKVRIISLPYVLQSGETLVIEIAETCNARTGMAGQVLSTQVWLQILVIAGSVMAVLVGVNRGLAPLTEIHKAMSERNPYDLQPLQIENPPDEVKPLIQANNQLLQQLQNHLDAQADFASNAAHQLRTPLTGLKTYVNLGERLARDEKVSEIFVQLNGGLSRMTQLVNRLLSLARVERRASVISIESVIDLNLLAGEAISELHQAALEKSIDLEFDSSQSPALIHGDAESIRELIENLIHNAICYTPKNGEIKVTMSSNEKVVFTVEDSGPGIAPAERARVFDRFYRVVGSQGGGSGLGLAIVKEIAQTHMAEVTISEGINGTGCKFTVSIPSAEQSPGQAPQIAFTGRKRAAVYPLPEADL